MNSWIIVSLLMINLHGPVDTYRTDTTMLAPDSSFKNIPQLPAMYLSLVMQKSMHAEPQVLVRPPSTTAIKSRIAHNF